MWGRGDRGFRRWPVGLRCRDLNCAVVGDRCTSAEIGPCGQPVVADRKVAGKREIGDLWRRRSIIRFADRALDDFGRASVLLCRCWIVVGTGQQGAQDDGMRGVIGCSTRLGHVPVQHDLTAGMPSGGELRLSAAPELISRVAIGCGLAATCQQHDAKQQSRQVTHGS